MTRLTGVINRDDLYILIAECEDIHANLQTQISNENIYRASGMVSIFRDMRGYGADHIRDLIQDKTQDRDMLVLRFTTLFNQYALNDNHSEKEFLVSQFLTRTVGQRRKANAS